MTCLFFLKARHEYKQPVKLIPIPCVLIYGFNTDQQQRREHLKSENCQITNLGTTLQSIIKIRLLHHATDTQYGNLAR